jgi:SNF2 family DNA or RNA helicase
MAANNTAIGSPIVGKGPIFVFGRKTPVSDPLASPGAAQPPKYDTSSRLPTHYANPSPVPSPQDPKLYSNGSPHEKRPSSMFDMRSAVGTSHELETLLHGHKSSSWLTSEELAKRNAEKKRLGTITALDTLIQTDITGFQTSHNGYLTYVTLSLLEDTPESSRTHFFSKKFEEDEIRSRYLTPTSMPAVLSQIAEQQPMNEEFVEKMAMAGVPSAEDVANGENLNLAPSRSVLRRLDEIYDILEQKLDEEDLKTLISMNKLEDRVKSIKKRQRPSDAPPPRFVSPNPFQTSSIEHDTHNPTISNRFELPQTPIFLRGPASKKRRLYIQGCTPAVEHRFVDMELHEEEDDIGVNRTDSSHRIWMMIVKREIPRVARIHSENGCIRRENAYRLAKTASAVVSERVLQVRKKSTQTQQKAKALSKSLYSYIRRNEKDWKKQADREADAVRRAEKESEEKERTGKKLNFLITQTELYSHFMSKKLGINAAEEELEKLKSATTMTTSATLKHLNDGDEEEQEAIARAEALRAYQAQRAKVDSFDSQTSKLRGTSTKPSSSAAATTTTTTTTTSTIPTSTNPPQGHRRTGGLVTQTMPIASSSSNNSDPSQSSLIEQPRHLNGTLKPYQVKGLNWLYNLYEQGINGILADEMGLGKTVQTISMLGHLAETRGIWGPFIVIAPTSTLPNWVNEFAKFYPAFKVLPYYGMARQRVVLRKLLNPNYLHRPDSVVHVIVTSYNLVVHDEKYISRIHWEYMILDEAHAIKSANSVRWQTLLSFGNTRNRLLLTGTPIQNNMAELWALLHFIMPTLFDSHNEFAEWFSKDIEDHAAGQAGLNEHQLNRLHMILKPFMLRRVKVDVQNELPSKTEIEVRCDMTARQRSLYAGIRNHVSIGELFDKINVPMGRMAQERQTKTLMNIVMQFRNVCNHPEIIDRSETESPMQFAPLAPPVVSYGTIIASANSNWIQYNLPRLVYNETLFDLDAIASGTDAEQTTRRKWIKHRFNIYSQLHIHSSIFGRRFESGEPNSIAITTSKASSSSPMISEVHPSQASIATKSVDPPNSMDVSSSSEPHAKTSTEGKKISFKELLAAKRALNVKADSPAAGGAQISNANPSSPATTTHAGPIMDIDSPIPPSINKEPHLDVFYDANDSTWSFVRLMDSSPAEVEWISQADCFRRWMAILGSRDRDNQLSYSMEHESDIENGGSSSISHRPSITTRSMLRIVPIFSSVAHHKVCSSEILYEMIRSDPVRRLMEDVSAIRAAWDAYRPKVWSAPIGIYCNDRRFTSYQGQVEQNNNVSRLLLGTSRSQSGPEDLIREVSSVRLARPSSPMAKPLLNVFGWSDICVPQYSELVRDSGKLKKLDELLKDMKKGGHRVLVYSQFTEVLDLLEDFMFVRGHKFVRLDGSSRLDERRDMVDAFQTDPTLFIFLLSTRAGGLGINLTAADTVIFYDSDWNPTMDAQAMDRAHRLGQTRPVTVYRLVTRNSVEERILQRAKQKGNIQNLVIQGGRFNLSPDEADDIFKPSEMMDLLLDEDQLQEINKADNAKRKRTIINPIKLGMKRSSKPNAKPAQTAAVPQTLSFDEAVEPVTSSVAPATAVVVPPTQSSSTAMDVTENPSPLQE